MKWNEECHQTKMNKLYTYYINILHTKYYIVYLKRYYVTIIMILAHVIIQFKFILCSE